MASGATHRRYLRFSRDADLDLELIKNDVSSALRTQIPKFSQVLAANHREMSVYVGYAGYGLMFRHLLRNTADHHAFSSNEEAEIEGLMAQSIQYLTHTRMKPSTNHVAFLETPVGQASLILAMAIEGGKLGSTISQRDCERCVGILQFAMETSSNDNGYHDDGCEVLYGKAGLLYTLHFLRRLIHDAVDSSLRWQKALRATLADTQLSTLVNIIISKGKQGASSYASEIGSRDQAFGCPPLMWSWHHKRYLGAAHGVVGILQMLLGCPSNLIDPYMNDIIATIDWILKLQDSEGNWPSKAPATSVSGQNELVQWCHGAPGVLILLSTLLKRSKSLPKDFVDRVTNALERGGSLVYRHGLLRKGVGLCHGAAGSVYALLATSDGLAFSSVSSKKRYLLRATHLAHLAAEVDRFTSDGKMSVPDRPWSLYEGVAGACCAWSDILCRISGKAGTGMPGYTDCFE